jgi:hypothetical protein
MWWLLVLINMTDLRVHPAVYQSPEQETIQTTPMIDWDVGSRNRNPYQYDDTP